MKPKATSLKLNHWVIDRDRNLVESFLLRNSPFRGSTVALVGADESLRSRYWGYRYKHRATSTSGLNRYQSTSISTILSTLDWWARECLSLSSSSRFLSHWKHQVIKVALFDNERKIFLSQHHLIYYIIQTYMMRGKIIELLSTSFFLAYTWLQKIKNFFQRYKPFQLCNFSILVIGNQR